MYSRDPDESPIPEYLAMPSWSWAGLILFGMLSLGCTVAVLVLACRVAGHWL